MIRQILGMLPKTANGKTENDEGAAASAGGFLNSIKALSSQGVSSVHAGLFGKAEPSSSSSIPPAGIANGERTAPFPVSHSPVRISHEPLPLFRDVPNSEKQNLFIRKLQLCSVVSDFSDRSKDAKEKELKKQTLHQLADFVSSANAPFSEIALQEATNMVALNIFRSLPTFLYENQSIEIVDFEAEEAAMDPAWCHLRLVYEFFLRFVTSSQTDPKVAKRFIDHSFVLKLLDLFDSEDLRERDYLKTILHRIYGKFMVHRPFIRKAINNIFYSFIFETERHNGISELLELLSSVVNGFTLPLKEEHKLFLVRALIPLHKPKCVSVYHRQLSYCITLFVEKDLKLADTVIRGLLKYWPITNSHKEVLFLGELEEVLEATQPAEFKRCMVPLFQQIGRCLKSPHFQVAERTLLLWNNDHIINLAAQNRSVILPIIYSALEKNSRGHWNQAVHSMTLNARKTLLEMDQELFQECKRQFEEEEEAAKLAQEKRELTWQRLEVIAAKSIPNQVVLVLT